MGYEKTAAVQVPTHRPPGGSWRQGARFALRVFAATTGMGAVLWKLHFMVILRDLRGCV